MPISKIISIIDNYLNAFKICFLLRENLGEWQMNRVIKEYEETINELKQQINEYLDLQLNIYK